MPVGAVDVFRRLTTLLLTAPRDPGKEELFRRANNLYGQLGYSARESPVAGVGFTRNDKGEVAIDILLSRRVERFSDGVQKALELFEFTIHQRYVGRLVAASRPATGGESLGEGRTGGASGTFGCLVRNDANQRFALSCHHVLAPVNNGRKGAEIWQPSHQDGGSGGSRVGALYDCAPIAVDGVTPNAMDAALAVPDQSPYLKEGLLGMGPVNGTAHGLPFRTLVRKVGWRTRQTEGKFVYRVNYLQHYPSVGDALFTDQLGIVGLSQHFSLPGDSGALVVNEANEAVGLLMATSTDSNFSIANPIWHVFDHFGVFPV
jgi:hypothetical protein